jgi:hypothetical protein
MANSDKAFWFFFGWASLLLLKYLVFGLIAWNNVLHPGLVTSPNQTPFLQPFMGLFPTLDQTPVASALQGSIQL